MDDAAQDICKHVFNIDKVTDTMSQILSQKALNGDEIYVQVKGNLKKKVLTLITKPPFEKGEKVKDVIITPSEKVPLFSSKHATILSNCPDKDYFERFLYAIDIIKNNVNRIVSDYEKKSDSERSLERTKKTLGLIFKG